MAGPPPLDNLAIIRIAQPLSESMYRRMAAVAERDGRRCAYCGVVLPLEWYGLDHVVPKSRMGRDHIINRVLACPPCDSSKANRTPQEWQPGVTFGNPVVDEPYRVPASQSRRVKVSKAPPFEPLVPKRPPPGMKRSVAKTRKGFGTTILYCTACATWVRVKGHAPSHLLIRDDSYEPR